MGGSLQQTIAVDTTDDKLNEASEEFTLTLTSITQVVGLSLGTASATGAITDNDALEAAVSATTTDVDEGSTAKFAVSLTAGIESTAPVEVRYTLGGTASSDDYTAPSGALTIAKGASSGTITIAIANDEVVDPGETLEVTLSSATTATRTVEVNATAARITITDTDTAQISIADAGTVDESTAASFEVTMSTAVGRDVELSYRTWDGTALAGADYGAKDDTLTLAAGTTSATLTVQTIHDTFNEPTENFTVTLTLDTQVSGLSVETGSATAEITDNDALRAAISEHADNVPEGTAATFTVTLSSTPPGVASTADVVVVYTVGGTATSADYTAPSAPRLTIDSGESSGTITIPTSTDSVLDPGETIVVTLTSASTAGTVTVDPTAVTTTLVEQGTETVSVAAATATEGAAANFVVTLSGAVSSAVEVSYRTSDGTAVAGSDYTGASDTLTFSVGGSRQQTIAVDTTDDTLNEATEDFTLTLTSITQVAGLSLGTASATGAITDNDALAAAVSADAANVDEGSAATFTVSLTAGIESTAPVEVRYTLGGTAGSNDYTAPTAPLTIVKGASSGTITIAIADDEVVDPGETLEVTLSAATTATRTVEVDTAAASTTITDADTATVAIANATVTEGDTASFVVTLSLPVESPVEVSFQTAQGSALPGTGNDYLTNSGTLTFSPGKSLQRTIEVTTVEDELSEAEETFTVSLTLNSAIDGLTLGTASATGTIEDDDAVPELALTSVTQRLAESGGSMTFTVSLGAASSRVVTVDFEAVDGTATADQDFAATEGTLTFRPGENRQRSVQVPILDDTMDEDDETFALELSNASNATLAGGRSTLAATGTIEDDDVLRAAVEADALTVVESNPATFTVELTGGTSMADVLVAYTVSGTATAGADYNAPGGILRITEGAASGTITIRTLADDMLDAGETLEVKLVSASSGTRPVTVDTTAIATTTIEDEGTVTVSIDGAAAEEGDTVSFAVALSGAVAIRVEVPYETSSGTGATDAGAGADYDVTRGTLTFEPNALEQTIRVATIEDSLNEADETFAVTLTDSGLPAGVSLGTASAAGTITDDDSQSARVGANAVSVTEGRAAAFAVTLTGGTSTAAVEVAYSVGGTATAGTDYNAPGGTLTIAAGSDSGTITIVTRTDGVVDPGETLEVQLTGATTATGTVTVVTTAATTTITEADTVMVSVAAATAEEGASLGFTVEMSGAVSTPVEVSWATSSESSDTAVANADYTTARGTLTFSPGQALTQTFIVPSREDTLNEASETFTVTLTASNPPSGVSLGTASATGTITDDDPLQAAVESMTKNVPEGNPAKFAVTLTGGTSTADVVVAYSVAGTATAGSDYTAPSGTLTLQPEATSATFTIATRTDDILDPGETLVVTLDSATTAGAATVVATAATATITQAGSVTVAVEDAAAEEGESVNFAVTLSGGVSSAVKVSYRTASGTEAAAADAATDYTAVTGTLTFNPDTSLEQTISVATTEDTLHEADETFTLTLTGVDLPAGVELGDATATGTIEDDDDEPTLALSSVTQSLAEGGGSMTFTVSLDAAAGQTVTVDYTTVNGTAQAGNDKDYAATSGTLTFSPDGVRQRNVAVRIHQDDLDEDDETFQFKLSSASNASLTGGGSTLAVTRTIVDDDVLAAAVTEVAKNVTEGDSAEFTVTVTGGTSTASVEVAYTVGGTATAGSDYTAPSGTLTLAAGAATGTIAIATLTDQALDAGETLEVRLVSASTATRIVVIDATAAATTSIVDAGAVTVSVADVTVTEGATASFKVTLSESVADPVEVTYETSSGTGAGDAEAGADYPVTGGTLTFSQGGSLEQTIRVPTTQDNLNEASEVFKVTLEGPDLPAKVVLGDAEATGTITDDDPLRVTLRAEAQNVAEGQPASFTVTVRDNTSTSDVVVDYTVAGTAEQDVDYAAPSGSLTIRQGKSSGTIAIATLTDDVLDPDETLEVTLTRATTAGRSVTVDTTAAVTTLAEQSTVTVSVRASTGGEGDVTAEEGEPLQFSVNLSGSASIAIEVPYQTANGTAAAGTDYAATRGTLTFSPNQTGKTVTVTTFEDQLNEADETFTLTLTEQGLPFGVDLETSSLTGTITDDDPLSVRVTAPSGSVTEGDPARFTVQFTGGTSTADVVVSYTVTGTATAGTDYTAPSGSVTIPAPASSGTITIHTINDNVLEADDDLSVTLMSAASAGAVSIDHTASTATATIADNDEVTVSIRPRGSKSAGRSARAAQTAGDISVREGDAVSFFVDLSGQIAPGVEVKIEYGTQDGTARANADYRPSSGTLTFTHSDASKTVTVQTIEDQFNEAGETFAVKIELAPDNPQGVNLGIDAVTAIIIDDDPLQATLSADDPVVREGESATFTVTLTPSDVASTADVLVDYRLSGTAIGGSDYTAPTGTLTIGQGTSSGTITIATRRDTDPEPDETLVVTLAAATSAGVVTVDPAPGVTSITDHVTVSAANVTTPEGDPAIVTVQLSDPVASAVVVSYRTASGSGTGGAVEGTDYTANSGRLTFSANAAGERTITIDTTDDKLNEAAESFTITLDLVSPPDGVRPATSTVRGTITDNDPLEAAVAVVTGSVAEGESAMFEVTLSGGATSTADVVVRFSVTGTATEGDDYTDPGPSVTIPAGAASGTITIDTLPDGQADSNETLVVTLEDARSAGTVTVDTTPATATISEQNPLRAALSDHPESVTEGEQAMFEVTLSGGTSTSDVIVDYLVEGTATAGVDYTTPDYRLTIRAGTTRGTIVIETLVDSVLDPDETLQVELAGASSATRAVIVVPTPVRTEIIDQHTVQVSAADASVPEGALAHFTVTLSDVVESAVEVAYETADGTAEAGTDYFPTNSSVIIPQGTRTGTITVATSLDSLNEADETFMVTLTLQTDLSGLSLDRNSVTGTIIDDDPLTATVEAASGIIAEGESAIFEVTLTGGTSTADVEVDYTMGGTADAGTDYTPLSGTLTIAAGADRGTITVDTHIDHMLEPEETLVVTLEAARSAGEVQVESTPATTTIAAVTVSVTAAEAQEGEPLRFEVTLAGEVTSAVAVSYGTSNGTAQAGRDYTATNGTLTFDPTSPARTLAVIVETREDELDEADETFTLTLRDPVNAELGADYSAVGTIVDDDEPPAIAIADAEAIESAGTISFAVTLSAESGRQVAVQYRTEDGTATADEDYETARRTLTIEPGKTRATVRIEVLNDTLDEPDETFEVWLSEPEYADLPDDTATGTIIDDDAPVAHVWLSRFGRTVATHVMDAVDDRLSAVSRAGSQVTVAGRRLQPVSAAARSQEVAVAPFRVMDGRELLDGSSFRLSSHVDEEESGGGKWTTWGRAAVTRLSGEEGEVDLRGDVVTTALGVDYDWGPVLTGLALGFSAGGAEYRLSRPKRELGAGDVGSWLVSAHPYARVSVIDRLEVWGLFGYGLGMMSLVEDHADEEHEAGVGLTMGALGVRGTVLSPETNGGWGLILKSDGFLARMNVEEIAGLAAAEADSSRIRLVAQGSYDAQLGDGSLLVPMVQTGLRYDIGHAEEGFGAEVGGGARFFQPQWGLTVTAHGRFLLVHEAGGYGEWGLRASALLNPTRSPYGLSGALSSSWGTPSSGIQRLWSDATPAPLAAGGPATSAHRLDAQVGYGVSVDALARDGGADSLRGPDAGRRREQPRLSAGAGD